jgi:DNA repair protein RecO (recombination protein O)
MLKKDHAICIRSVDYSETSQVLTMFCRETGKLGLMAKGARRTKSPFGGVIEIFSHGEVVFSEHSEARLSTLTEFERHGDFGLLRRRLPALNAAFFGIELINLLTFDKDPHPDVYDSLNAFLGNLEQVRSDAESLQLLIVFQLSLLGSLGTGTVLGRCANCSASHADHWRSYFFSSTAHGVICRDCEGSFSDRVQVSPQAGACLIDPRNIATASAAILTEVERTIILHLSAILNRSPRMAKYFLPA